MKEKDIRTLLKETITGFLFLIVMCGGFYLLGAFIAASGNPGNWLVIGRILYAIIVITMVYLTISYLHNLIKRLR